MTFASPMMLWSLLALVPLLGVYFLKVRPRRRPTTAFFLWEKVFHQRRSNRLWHRLRNLWSLLLMALAFTAVALALGDPRFSSYDRPDLLIIIDNSASMQASSAGQTRLEIAKSEASDIVRALDGVQRAAVATVADRLRYESHLTDNPRELLAAIDQIQPTYEPLRIEALPVAHSETAGQPPEDGDSPKADQTPSTTADRREEDAQEDSPQRRILLVSDGVLGGHQPPVGIELICVGKEVEHNVGLVAVDASFVPGSGNSLRFYFQIASTGAESKEVDLLLYEIVGDGQPKLQKVIPLTVEQGINKPQVMTVEDAEPGKWLAELDVDDALAADNTARLVARRPPPVRVGVASSDRFFFENSVHAFGHAAGGLELTAEDPEIIVAKGTPGDAERAIVFQPEGDSPWWIELGEEVEVGAARVLVDDHPVLRHLDPLSLGFAGAKQLVPPSGSQVIVASERGVPLVYVAKASGRGAVVVNMDPVAADFYFSAWFPTLVHSAAMHLAGREESLLAAYPVTSRVSLSNSTGPLATTVHHPDGSILELPPTQAAKVAEPGFYELEQGGSRAVVACSLLASRETLLENPADSHAAANIASGSPPSAWLSVLALLVITAESVLYHRRKVG